MEKKKKRFKLSIIVSLPFLFGILRRILFKNTSRGYRHQYCRPRAYRGIHVTQFVRKMPSEKLHSYLPCQSYNKALGKLPTIILTLKQILVVVISNTTANPTVKQQIRLFSSGILVGIILTRTFHPEEVSRCCSPPARAEPFPFADSAGKRKNYWVSVLNYCPQNWR